MRGLWSPWRYDKSLDTVGALKVSEWHVGCETHAESQRKVNNGWAMVESAECLVESLGFRLECGDCNLEVSHGSVGIRFLGCPIGVCGIRAQKVSQCSVGRGSPGV